MHSLGVIRFPHINEHVKLAGGMEKIFPDVFNKYILELSPMVCQTILFEKLGLKVEEIQFPFLIKDKDKMSRARFERAIIRITKVLHQKGITEIFFDKGTIQLDLEEAFLRIEKSLRILDGIDFYGVYIVEILNYVCKKMGIKLQNLPVTLILDDADDFFRNILKDLCTKVRFLSIISDDSENFIPVANEIYSEIGLVIRLDTNMKSKKGDYGIIINFSKNKNFVNANKLSRKYIILNFGTEFSNNYNGILITDIIIRSKSNDIKKYSWTQNPAFCEALGYKLVGADNKDKTELLKKQKKMITGLKAAGYEICGIKGVRGEIKTEVLADFGEMIKPKIVNKQ